MLAQTDGLIGKAKIIKADFLHMNLTNLLFGFVIALVIIIVEFKTIFFLQSIVQSHSALRRMDTVCTYFYVNHAFSQLYYNFYFISYTRHFVRTFTLLVNVLHNHRTIMFQFWPLHFPLNHSLGFFAFSQPFLNHDPHPKFRLGSWFTVVG